MGNSGSGTKKNRLEGTNTTPTPAKQEPAKKPVETAKPPKQETHSHPASKGSDEAHSPKKTTTSFAERLGIRTEKDDTAKKVEKFFDTYKDPECEEGDERISPEGLVKLFEDLNIDPEDPTALVLAYHMEAKEAATFTKSEFEAGCKKLGVDSLESLKAKWPTFKTTLTTNSTFKEIYKFTFNYMKEDPAHKTVSLEISKAYLTLLIGDRPHVASFVEYLDHQTTYKGLNLDQWMTLLDFIGTVKEDLSNYDENGAWPVVLDSFVEWKRQQSAQTAAAAP